MQLFLAYLFIHNQLYIFRAMSSPIISQQQYRWTISEAVNTVKCSWWWTKTSPETRWAV